jgi:PTS system galactitol-specific IIA component
MVVGLSARDGEEVIRTLVELLHDNGCCELEYAEEVLEREALYPTGLPTEGVFIAIPHANSTGNIHKSTIGIALLDEPVKFRHMTDNDLELDVKIVFLLANRVPEEQLSDLRALMECFGDSPETLAEMAACETVDSLLGILERVCA